MKTLKDMLSHDRFAAEAGVELLEVREGYAKARMLVTDKHLNGGGVCQGGALFTLADLANITFLRAVSSGYVYAEAVETFNHAKIPFIEVRITDEEGCPVAVFTSSGYRKKTELNLENFKI